MTRFSHKLPQLEGGLFLTDAGLETDLIFNRGIAIREFAAHTLLPDQLGRAALEEYFTDFLKLAHSRDAGFILDAVTWKAHRHWAEDIGQSVDELRKANEDAVAFIADIRDKAQHSQPIVLNAQIGPRGDAYSPEGFIEAGASHAYYQEQLRWLADTQLDMVTGLTFTQAGEAEGFVRAAAEVGLPCVISFTLETDGRLPTGQQLQDAIKQVDEATQSGPAYYMINCAHPDHFAKQLCRGEWRKRLRGIRANASRRSHAELDEAPELDAGDPDELARQYRDLVELMPWVNVLGACCGADLRHVKAISDQMA